MRVNCSIVTGFVIFPRTKEEEIMNVWRLKVEISREANLEVMLKLKIASSEISAFHADAKAANADRANATRRTSRLVVGLLWSFLGGLMFRSRFC